MRGFGLGLAMALTITSGGFADPPVKWIRDVMDPEVQQQIGIEKLTEHEQLALGAYLVKAMNASERGAQKAVPGILTAEERAQINKSDSARLLLMVADNVGPEALIGCGLVKLTAMEFTRLGRMFQIFVDAAKKEGFQEGVKSAVAPITRKDVRRQFGRLIGAAANKTPHPKASAPIEPEEDERPAGTE